MFSESRDGIIICIRMNGAVTRSRVSSRTRVSCRPGQQIQQHNNKFPDPPCLSLLNPSHTQTYLTSLTMPATTRAKAVEGKKPDPQTSKVNTPASKAAPVAGRAKRKLRTEEDNDLPDPDKPAKERTEHDASSQKGAIASGPTAKLVEKPNLLAPKAPRGRPKKNNPVSSADPPAEVAPDAKAAAGSTRATTRARAGSVAEETAKGTKVLALAVKQM